jgi:hypothetical protein
MQDFSEKEALAQQQFEVALSKLEDFEAELTKAE